MDTRNDKIKLPEDILILIMSYSIRDDFSNILLFRLISKRISYLLENNSLLPLSLEIFNTLPEESEKILKKSKSCIFFKMAKNEEKRLIFNIKNENRMSFGMYEDSNQHANPSLSYKQFVHLKENFLVVLKDTETLQLNNVIIRERDCLPDDIELFIVKIVNIRLYEKIQELYQTAKNITQINLDRLIDAIYVLAMHSYNMIEFMQLMNVVPIDINREIAYLINLTGVPRQYLKKPLLYFATKYANLDLFQYLLDVGADIYQLSNDKDSLLYSIDKQLALPPTQSKKFNNLLEIKKYLLTITNEDINEPEKKRPCIRK